MNSAAAFSSTKTNSSMDGLTQSEANFSDSMEATSTAVVEFGEPESCAQEGEGDQEEEGQKSRVLRRRTQSSSRATTEQGSISGSEAKAIHANMKEMVFSAIFGIGDVGSQWHFSPYTSLVLFVLSIKDYIMLVRRERAVYKQIKVINEIVLPVRKNAEQRLLNYQTLQRGYLKEGIAAYSLMQQGDCLRCYRHINRCQYFINSYDQAVESCDQLIGHIFLADTMTSLMTAVVSLGTTTLSKTDKAPLQRAEDKLIGQFIDTASIVDRFSDFQTKLESELQTYDTVKSSANPDDEREIEASMRYFRAHDFPQSK